MDVFFYDYDDFDHTTALVDWFETELVGEDAGSEGQQQVIVNGNRQSDKTRLEFQWARHCYGAKGCLPHLRNGSCGRGRTQTRNRTPWRQVTSPTTGVSGYITRKSIDRVGT
ncbi:uncharacterized protein LOC112554261 [Pomacea canaliculata]|uniref:uncharacterized protein LOC112554261 n=1 Tax=Pomacea canaliculata TaxID=400727 RepID=UPI000D72847C|nr:uncharacterized protein LOC112554261 [Pomacea canaliculata]